MTKEELEYNRGYRYGYEMGNLNGYKLRKSEEKHCEDAISRQAAKDKLKAICKKYCISYEDGERKPSTGGSAFALGHAFDDLPPVKPARKKGKWIDRWDKILLYEDKNCSICGFLSQTTYNYCPNCGAKMGEEE